MQELLGVWLPRFPELLGFPEAIKRLKCKYVCMYTQQACKEERIQDQKNTQSGFKRNIVFKARTMRNVCAREKR